MIDATWLESSSNPEEAADLTAQLVALKSYPGEEGEVQRAVADWLSAHDLLPELQQTEGDRPNVIARVENGDGPTLLLNGHVDTVLAVEGWSSDPWWCKRDGDKLYGLGACDMKAGVAAAMMATRALAQRRDLWSGTLIFSSVVDEEAYSIGARALISSGIQADACIVTESSWLQPALGSVGKTLVMTDVTGKAAHATWPADGINAAVEASRFVALLGDMELGRHPRLASSQCVLSFLSGSAQYVITVPEKARVLINRHIVPGETGETVLEQMRTLATSLASQATFDFNIQPPYYPPWEIDLAHPFAQIFDSAYRTETGLPPNYSYRGFGDANLFSSELGVPTIQFGPHGANYHQANEWVDVPSVGGTVRVLLRVALAMLG